MFILLIIFVVFLFFRYFSVILAGKNRFLRLLPQIQRINQHFSAGFK